MQEFEKRLILLHHCRGIGWKSIHTIIRFDNHLHQLFTRSPREWQDMLHKLKPSHLTSFYHDLHSVDLSERLRQYEMNSIIVKTIFQSDYPERLRNIHDPPWVLYMKGNERLLHQRRALAVVGARKPSEYGRKAIAAILPGLVDKGYVIVSGLASGIDACAHQTAMYHKGSTIAVLGGGLHQIYPKENTSLALKMMKEQLVLSETPPMQRAEPWMFPMRNRIISGLSDGVFIVEAKERSGSLITALQALEQGREIFALPGGYDSPLSKGTNKLIQEGAKLVLAEEDITDEFPYKK